MIASFRSHLFFLFFTSPILSPGINGFSIYLYWFIPLFDARWIISQYRSLPTRSGYSALVSGAFIFLLTIFSPIDAAKWLAILLTINYAIHLHNINQWKLDFWMKINILIAFAQAITFLFLGDEAKYLFGPEAIAKDLWGKYATGSNSNFYSIFQGIDLPRFSGLSREGGFFASLLIAWISFNYASQNKASRQTKFYYILGLALSLSKMTTVLPLSMFLVWLIKRRVFLHALAIPFISFAFFGGVYVIVEHPLVNLELSDTFTDRFFPYVLFFDDIKSELGVLFGSSFETNILVSSRSFQACAYWFGKSFCENYPSMMSIPIKIGIVGFLVYITCLYRLGIRNTFSFFLILVLTINVSPLTATSFVVLSYITAMYVDKSRAFKNYGAPSKKLASRSDPISGNLDGSPNRIADLRNREPHIT